MNLIPAPHFFSLMFRALWSNSGQIMKIINQKVISSTDIHSQDVGIIKFHRYLWNMLIKTSLESEIF